MCIFQENREKSEKVYDIFTQELDSMRDLLVEYDVGEIVLKSTSIYRIPI